MQVLSLIRSRFAEALSPIIADPKQLASSLERIVPSREPSMADYQANIAMPLKKVLGREPLDIANDVVSRLKLDDICSSVTVAGQGYINLRLSPKWLSKQLYDAYADARLGVAPVGEPKTFVVDFSSPNVAKPMHVGHIRSTVIGDSISKILRFLGHKVVTDNHLGDWGTQFGMIIYGYKNFRDQSAYESAPVAELSRIYRVVQNVISYQSAVAAVAKHETALRAAEQKAALAAERAGAAPQDKKLQKDATAAQNQVKNLVEQINGTRETIQNFESQPALVEIEAQHKNLEEKVLAETAKLHHGDKENLKLWDDFLPNCKAEIHSVYKRLGIQFDYEYGESFYHDMLQMVVEDLLARSMATQSDGAICVFLEGFDAPMIVQKQDGAFLYATTDIATAMFREREFAPDASLYVVDHRQSEHFNKLFAVLNKIGLTHTDFRHVSFGTVMGKDGKPFKTRSGSLVGLESLLDEAVERAWQVVCNDERLKASGIQLTDEEKRNISEVVGIGAIKYADLMHNRTSNYVFDMEKMVALIGNTSAYIQYSYARSQNILRKSIDAGFDPSAWATAEIELEHPSEQAIALQLIRFEELLIQSTQDYLPNLVAEYLYELAQVFSSFLDQCHIIKAETAATAHSRLKLAALVGKTLRCGLELLGIGCVERM